MFGAVIERYETLDSRARIAALHDLEQRRRALDAEYAALVSVVEHRAEHSIDGAKSIAGWLRMHTGCSTREASRRVRISRLTHHYPALGDSLAKGRISADHVEAFHRVHRNERCRERVPELVELILTEPTIDLPVADFTTLITEFEQRVDTDGSLRSTNRSHDDRHATVTSLGDDSLVIEAVGHGIIAAEIREIFERFLHAEWLTDWHDARATHGDEAAGIHLARTEPQRRFDALVAIFRTAASAPADGVRPEPVVNIVVDETTFNDHLAHVLLGTPIAQRHTIDLINTARCSHTDGRPANPTEVAVAALHGHVRRVVYGTGNVPINLGRTTRLFTGGARAAAQLAGDRCLWPGCDAPVQRCQIDHLQPWSRGGPTDQTNAGPCCGRHNRFKQRGYTVRRDPTGRWLTFRPDGTELGPTTQPAA